jgi:glycosyltransferase involved in cell wall biosynthesis
MRIAMIAPPWLRMPPDGYGGIEYVVHDLTVELQRLGHEVILYATGDTKTPATELHTPYEEGQFRHIAEPLYEALGIPLRHLVTAINDIAGRSDIDLIHDHNVPLGSAILKYARHLPPSLHTFHGPFVTSAANGARTIDECALYQELATDCGRCRFSGISHQQLSNAPPAFVSACAGVVHNGVNLDAYPFVEQKESWFLTLARINRSKGHSTAARICREIGAELRLAGTVPGFHSVAALQDAARSMAEGNPDLRYYRDEVMPELVTGQIEHLGEITGELKHQTVGRAKALLFPIQWDEPFGLAAIEALACGTPVVAMNRGALPEIVEHGVNGFLANDEAEFAQCMARVDEIDPAVCRRTVEERFSAQVMTQGYLDTYERVLGA